MKLSQVTEGLLRCMDTSQRRSLGKAGMLPEEAQAAFVARSEKELQEAITKLLTLRGIAFYRSRMDRKTSGTVGWPDFTFALAGAAVALEVKHEKGETSPEQIACIAKMRSNGWHVYIVRSLPEVRDILDGREPKC